jgi:sugar/nucleoside kinase (ribokinase family)
MNNQNELMVVGSVALDSVETPFGKMDDLLGGSAVHFSLAASLYSSVGVVGVVGEDFPAGAVDLLRAREIDLDGLQRMPGETFRWGGRYGYDLNHRETLFTHLNVFEQFKPAIPDGYRITPFLFLGNIDPQLQSGVLEQVRKPRIVAGDTMNYWIDGKKSDLMAVISRLNILLLNDAEARQLADEPNLIKAARAIVDFGPECVVVKKGEHGAMMVTREGFFFAPPFPLETVIDPTGAGDSFAGGFMGYLSRCGEIGESELRNAVIHGTVVASFCVEDFGTRRVAGLTVEDIASRVDAFSTFTNCGLSSSFRRWS